MSQSDITEAYQLLVSCMDDAAVISPRHDSMSLPFWSCVQTVKVLLQVNLVYFGTL